MAGMEPTSSVSAAYTWSVFSQESMCSTGARGRHGLMSSTASKPTARMRSADARNSHTTLAHAMSRVPAK